MGTTAVKPIPRAQWRRPVLRTFVITRCESCDDELVPAIVREDADNQLSEITSPIPPVDPGCIDVKHSAFLAQLLHEEVVLEPASEQRSPVGKPVLHVQHICSGESAARNTGTKKKC